MLTSTAVAQVPSPADSLKPLATALAELDKSDPGSPAALSGRLEYVDLLLRSEEGACQQRLDNAQSELDTATKDPAFEVVVPAGVARQEDLEYRIHAARASCNAPDRPKRQNELHQALAAAQRSVDLYRDAFDYPSTAAMEFDIAITQRLLGNDLAAVAALRSTIDMDREYGFHDDAVDNYALLAKWTGDTSATRGGMEDFPARRVTLKFGWSICNAHVTIDATFTRVVDGAIERYQAGRTFKRAYRVGLLDWRVENEPGQLAIEISRWPQDPEVLHDLGVSLERALLQVPDINVRRQGELARVVRSEDLSEKLSKATQTLFLQHTGSPGAHARLPHSMIDDVNRVFASGVIEEKAAEDYSFETGIWIDATLEQGVWYRLSAPLTVPGTIPAVMDHDVEFAYTRQVQCDADSTDRSCVELVVRANPEADALQSFVDDLNDTATGRHLPKAHFWAATYMRIVTDPKTLLTHFRDVRNYWHFSTEGGSLDEIANQSERLLVTSVYH
jgi:hypothetical protein